MPLSKASPRHHIHTREITCRGFKRDDGMWDIEGRLTDTKTYSFDSSDRNGVAAGEPIHDMLIRLTVDDDFLIHAAEAASDSTPFDMCGEATSAFAKLVGLKVGPGWRKKVQEAMGGIDGCTHLRDLVMGPLAVTAFQTIYPARRREQGEETPKPGEKPRLLETCHAFRRDGPVVERRWPEFYEPAPGKADGKKAG